MSTLKPMSNKFGEIFCCHSSPNKYRRLDNKLERKMMEVKRSASECNHFRSIDSIILKFPQFKKGLKQIRGIFEQYDEDSSGSIDRDELKKCMEKLQLQVNEEEVNDLFCSCDMNDNEGIQFNEFIVLLCVIYLLMYSSTSSNTTSMTGSPQIEATFNTIVEAFLFLDKNGDGKLNKKEVIKALNDGSPWEKSPSHLIRTRFEEMDWDKDGTVSFREFLYTVVNWVGIDSDDENATTENSVDSAKKEGKRLI